MKRSEWVLAALIAGAVVTAVGVLVGLAISRVALSVRDAAPSFDGVFAIVVNLLSHLTAFGLLVLMARRASESRVPVLRRAADLTLGYALVVFVTSVIGEAGAHALGTVVERLHVPLPLLNLTVYFPL